MIIKGFKECLETWLSKDLKNVWRHDYQRIYRMSGDMIIKGFKECLETWLSKDLKNDYQMI